MKTGILKTAILIAVGASLSACGDDSKGKTKAQGLDAKNQGGIELTGEPGTAEEMVNQTYRLKTVQQEFVLKNLAHLVWAKFECKAETVDGDQKKSGVMTVSFYPTFEIKNKSDDAEKTVVSPTEVCGLSLTAETSNALPTGHLLKDENNQYQLQYGLPNAGMPLVSMTWDAANATPGEITCTNSEGKTAKATLTECTLVPVVTEPKPELPQTPQVPEAQE